MARAALPDPLPWDPVGLNDPVAIIERTQAKARYPGFIYRCPATPEGRCAIEALGHPTWSYRRVLEASDRVCCLRALEKSEWNLVIHSPTGWTSHKGDAFTRIASAGSTEYRSGLCWLIRRSEVENSSSEPMLYQSSNGYPCRQGVRFDEWFLDTWRRMIRQIRLGHARRYLDGPRPFTPEEDAIVTAWRGFSWRLVDRDPQNLHLLLRNDSPGRLRRYTIRVRDTGLIGGFFLNVADIGPGEERLIIEPLGGYASLTTTATIKLEGMPEPRPETRRDYGEFRHFLP